MFGFVHQLCQPVVQLLLPVTVVHRDDEDNGCRCDMPVSYSDRCCLLMSTNRLRVVDTSGVTEA